MLIISVKINIKDYPSNSFTSGVHISFHTQGSNNDSGSGLIASSGQVTLIRLKKTINEYLNNTTIESFDGKISTIGDYNFEENWGNKNDTVVLAMTYQDLNVMIVKELPPYDILTFLSETGGVLGLLLGTSLVNLIVFLIQWAWGLKFNETNWVNVQNQKEEECDKEGKYGMIGCVVGVLSGNNFGNFSKEGYFGEDKNYEKYSDDYCKDNKNNNHDFDKEGNEKESEKKAKNSIDRVSDRIDKTRESEYFNSSGDLGVKNQEAYIYQKISII